MGKGTGNMIIKKWRRIVFVLVAFVMYYLISYLLHPYARHWEGYFNQPVNMIVAEWVFSLLFCLAISEISIRINKWLNKWLPWTGPAVYRAMLQTTLQILCVVFIILFQIFIFFPDDFSLENQSLQDMLGFWNWISASIIIGLIISTINTGNYLIESWKKTATDAAEYKLRAAEHKQAAAEAELQALKLQIDPHFVFNNLSVLSELILEDQQLGYAYAENFSKVYRYLLVNSKKDLISVEDELKFLNAYIFLIKHRLGNGVRFEINIDEQYLNLHMLPLTLQLLIENALKHNKTNRNNPLCIQVFSTEDEELVVKNTLIPLQNQAYSSGIGLHNIIDRYKLLTNKSPRIAEGDHVYEVVIPLIRY